MKTRHIRNGEPPTLLHSTSVFHCVPIGAPNAPEDSAIPPTGCVKRPKPITGHSFLQPLCAREANKVRLWTQRSQAITEPLGTRQGFTGARNWGIPARFIGHKKARSRRAFFKPGTGSDGKLFTAFVLNPLGRLSTARPGFACGWIAILRRHLGACRGTAACLASTATGW